MRRNAATVALLATLGMAGRSLAQSAATAPSPDPNGFDARDHLLGDPFGYRSALADRGVTIDPSIVFDESKNLRGGLDTAHDAPRGQFSLAINADTEKLVGLHGGTLSALFQDQVGVNAAARQTGDLQNFSFGTNNGTPAQLTQLYYQQKLLPGDLLRVKGASTPRPRSRGSTASASPDGSASSPTSNTSSIPTAAARSAHH